MGMWVNKSRGRTNNSSPRALGICDRCGGLWNNIDLRWQYDWAGAQLQNKRVLVCPECYDIPNQQLRSILIPADPVPIQNPRPQIPADGGPNAPIPEVIMADLPDTFLVTEDGDNLVTV